MHVDAGGCQGLGALAQEVGDLLVGEVHHVGHGGCEQGSQRRPCPDRAAQCQQCVGPRARAERLTRGRRAGPESGGVRDVHRPVRAVHLEHGTEPHGVVHLADAVAKPVRLHPQRQTYARVVAGGDVVGPRAQAGQVLGLGRGERGAARHEPGGGGAGQDVGDRVKEGAHQPLRIRQAGPSVHRERRGVRLRGHGGGELTDQLGIARGQRSDPPHVVVGRREAGQQQTARQ
ncbi:hypothetical protein [Streptomyces sp. NPDC052292]|uniref:hypothetical protein n=1 Tax=Streptomyces sp. NPDC052292 TaxID=3155053 RepID=UPI0034240F1C